MLAGAATVNVQRNDLTNPAGLTLSGAIRGSGPLTKLGPASLTFSGAQPNTYTGATRVLAGGLRLMKSSGVTSVPGDLVIDTTGANDDFGAVATFTSEQIADAGSIRIGGSSSLNVGATETLGRVSAGGNARLWTGIGFGNFTAMTGTVILAGDVTATGNGSVSFLGDFALSGTPISSCARSAAHWRRLRSSGAERHRAPIRERADPLPRGFLVEQRALVVSGEGDRLVMAGGGTSWLDLALYLIARTVGVEEAMQVARVNLIDWHTVGQQPFARLAKTRQVDDASIGRAQAWIAEHYREPSPVAAMAEASGLAERSFKRRFRSATGMSPLEYVHTLRLEEAKQMLESADRPVEEVAFEVGYADAGFFSRLFRRRVGLTPSHYWKRFGSMRRELRGDDGIVRVRRRRPPRGWAMRRVGRGGGLKPALRLPGSTPREARALHCRDCDERIICRQVVCKLRTERSPATIAGRFRSLSGVFVRERTVS